MTTQSHNERTCLIQKQEPDEGDRTLMSLPYGAASRPPASPTRDNTAINNPGSPRQVRTSTLQSEMSVTSFGGTSMFGAEADPRDVQELLDNLDRATGLIRKHLQEQEGHVEGGGYV